MTQKKPKKWILVKEYLSNLKLTLAFQDELIFKF